MPRITPGVYSTLKQSGTSVGKGRVGKEGSRHGRRVLFQVVLRCIRSSVPDNDFKDYYLCQVARGKPKLKAVVSTIDKLAESSIIALVEESHIDIKANIDRWVGLTWADR